MNRELPLVFSFFLEAGSSRVHLYFENSEEGKAATTLSVKVYESQSSPFKCTLLLYERDLWSCLCRQSGDPCGHAVPLHWTGGLQGRTLTSLMGPGALREQGNEPGAVSSPSCRGFLRLRTVSAPRLENQWETFFKVLSTWLCPQGLSSRRRRTQT